VPELLEFVEEALDEVSLFVGALGVGDVVSAIDFGRNAGLAVLILDDVEPPRVCRGLFGLSHAASFCSSSMA
jgi:hypothetical protein